VETALNFASQSGMTVSLDLASYNVVEDNLAFLKMLISQFNPVLFANEEEARAFSGQTDPHKALAIISSFCDTAIVKIGAKGSLIRHKGKTTEVDAIEANCIDTTGAGDLYAAGYLYGYVHDMMPDQCGMLGSLMAGKVIEEPGAKISETGWDYIRNRLKTIRG
jgi:sugar/nucleoside kinase (ribokinase family)